MRQGIGRAARMGQTGTVTVRLYACKRSLDEHFIEILTTKLKEQMRLDGKQEPEKIKLEEAFRPTVVKDKIKQMLEKYRKLEAEQ